MRRTFATLLLVTAALAAIAGPVAADHVGQTLDCGEAGTYTVVGQGTGAGFDVPIGETNLFMLADTSSVYVIKEVYVDGILRFQNPGFAANQQELVRCTFVGPRTGRVYVTYGILT
jgi:hypothetical protein